MGPAESIPRRLLRPAAGANPLRAGRELLLSFGFRCNFACTFCYVEDGLAGRYRGLSLDDARRVLADPTLTEGVTRIVLSGGEVTLDPDLAGYIAAARAVPSVEHIRIQTNASRLADDDLAARLVALGVDELFVSLHAADAKRCDAITQRPGSFDSILAGLDAARAAGVTVITNTVICAANVDTLADVIVLSHERGAAAAELWGYVPRVDATDQRQQLVRVTAAAPHVLAALATAEARGLPVTVKYFPRCLLGRFAGLQSDAQPRLVIDDVFWKAYPQYGCVYEGSCAAAVDDGCTGLSDTYVRKFGWEEDSLVPFEPAHGVSPRGDDDAKPAIAAYHSWAQAAPRAMPSTSPLDASEVSRVRTLVGLADGATVAGARLVSLERLTGVLRLRFSDDAIADSLAIDLMPRDGARTCFARTSTLDLIHPLWPAEITVLARPLLAALAEHLEARDDGALARALFAPARESAVSSRSASAPHVLPAAWPAPEHPAAVALLDRVNALVAAGQLAPSLVEPSVALGRPDAWRLLVNAIASEPTQALLAVAGAPTWLVAHAARWLALERRDAYLALDATATRARLKLYLPTPDAQTRHAAAELLAIAPLAVDVQMIAIDAEDEALIAHKRYRRITPAEARARFAGPLLALLEARGLLLGELVLLAASRHDPAGRVIDEALHVDVRAFPQLALGDAWARACGDAEATARIASSGRTARVLSETVNTEQGRHVYLAAAP